MLIKRLEVKGFKSLKDVVWEPGPLAILIGPNGSGKSNLLLVLEFLKHSALGTLNKQLQALGGVHSIFWDGNEENIDIATTIDLSESFFSHTITAANYKISLRSYYWNNTYDIIDEQLSVQKPNSNEPINTITRDDSKGSSLINNKPSTYWVKDKNFDTKEAILSRHINTFDTAEHSTIINYNLNQQAIYRDILTGRNAEIRRPVVARFEKNLAPDGQNLVNVLHTLYSENRDWECPENCVNAPG